MNVPLVIKLPGSDRPRHRVDEQTSIVDILPTMLEAAGIPPLDWAAGISLLGAANGTGPTRPVYFASLYGVKAIVRDNLKLISHWDIPHGRRRAELRLFDLSTDPGERDNLAVSREALLEDLWATQDEFVTLSEQKSEALAGIEFELDPEQIQRLRSLGYIR